MKADIPAVEDPDLQVAPLIDCVFQLLIFFMVSASLTKSEGDLGIKLPGVVQQSVTVDMPDEQMIEVRSNGSVYLNGREFGSADTQDLSDLAATLIRYRQASAASKNKALITIWADDETKHQRVIDVMDACAAAGIENVTFTSSGGM
jgi:biopolymer transport protein ExbD